MTKINSLIEPSLDAADYNDNDKKDFFIKSYFQTQIVRNANKKNTYFIIGEKGTGKTALAYNIKFNPPQNTKVDVISIAETQYKRFILMRENGKLSFTDYSIIWSSTLLFLVSKIILRTNSKLTNFLSPQYSIIEKNLNKYHDSVVNPELEVVSEIVTTLTTNTDVSFKSGITAGGVANENSESIKTTHKGIKPALIECDKVLRDGLKNLKLKNDIVLFLDGIDAKPGGVSEEEFRSCITGLAEATLELNKSFFSNIKDSKGKCRIVLLFRPDVFVDTLNLNNSNCKLFDNSVILNWETTSERYSSSDLYRIADKYFTSQTQGQAGWIEYFDKIPKSDLKGFKQIIDNSFQRPRDVFAFVKILIELHINNILGDKTEFNKGIFYSSELTDKFSDYLLGEVRNYSNFHLSNKDFDNYLIFFQYLKGKVSFNYQEFKDTFSRFVSDSRVLKIENKKYLESCDELLQFWYDANIISYIDKPIDGTEIFRHYSYRDRSKSDIMPKVRLNGEYIIHYGLARALNLGKQFS